MNSWIFAALFSFTLANAGIQDHLKPALNKEGPHQIEGVDFIYMINLDLREEKFAKASQQLKKYGIEPYRFSAVSGWELSWEAIQDLGVRYEPWMQDLLPNGQLMGTTYPTLDLQPHHEKIGQPGSIYFSHCMSRGAIGIILSHLSILQDAFDSGYETIWIMEDDIEVVQDPNILSKLIADLDLSVGKDQWDILFTDQDTRGSNGKYVPCLGFAPRPNFVPFNRSRFSKRKPVDTQFRKIGARFGAYSFIIRRSGMEKLLRFFEEYKIFLPFDMEFFLPDDIQLYAVRRDIVRSQLEAPSDNGAPRYLETQKNL